MKMQNELLKNYFLGLLNPTNLEQVELRILDDDSLEADLLQAEHDLIEDYLDANLTNEEIIAFNQNFLVTKERRKWVEFIRLLKGYAENHPFIEKKPSFFEQLKALLTPPKIVVGFAAIVLIILLGIGFSMFNNPKNNLETEIASLNKEDLSNLAEYKNLKTLNLVSENLRSLGNANLLSQRELTDKVLLRLALPAPIKSEQTFSVSIVRNGQSLERFSQRSYQNQEVRLLLPKSILNQGEYRITISQDQEKYTYYFAIQ